MSWRGVRVVLVAAGVFVCWAGPAAAANFTWSGGDTATPTAVWSDAANWVGGVAPAADATAGAISFPELTSGGCVSVPPIGTCYASDNDVTGLIAGQLDFNSHAGLYSLSGNELTLEDGIKSASDASVSLPIALGAPQTWNVAGSFDVFGPVSGDQSLTIDMSPAASLNLGNPLPHIGGTVDDEIGPVTVEGGTINLFGELNDVDGNPVVLKETSGLLGDTLGPLTLQDSQVTFEGTVNVPSASFDNLSTVTLAPSSSIASTGAIDLGGADLASFGGVAFINEVDQPQCDAEPIGTTEQLVSTTGELTGTFGNVPEGAIVYDGCGGQVRINYHESGATQTVTGTFLGKPTQMTLSVGPQSARTNQQMLLTAQVSFVVEEPPGELQGSVAFEQGGVALPGCGAVPLRWSGDNYTTYLASCEASFAATSSPVPISAVFTPQDSIDPGYLASTGTASLDVSAGSTSTQIAASAAAPAAGENETYTATVIPTDGGSAMPTGAVAFLDRNTTIGSCDAQPLNPRADSSVATCTVSYPATGSHVITATYAGDGNFTGSQTESPVSVTAAAPKPPALSISVPRSGASYAQGSTVKASYDCTVPSGLAVSSCAGQVADGAAVDTASPGRYSFTVNADDGTPVSQTVTYTVQGAPTLSAVLLRTGLRPVLRLTISAGLYARAIKTILLTPDGVAFSSAHEIAVRGATGRALRFRARVTNGRLTLSLATAAREVRLTLAGLALVVRRRAKSSALTVRVTDAGGTTTKLHAALLR
jgi:hypothetical protein